MFCVQFPTGVSCEEIKTKADTDDVYGCPPYDMQNTGMLAVSIAMFFVVICFYDVCTSFSLLYVVLSHSKTPRAGSGVVRMDPLSFLAGCRTRRLNQV